MFFQALNAISAKILSTSTAAKPLSKFQQAPAELLSIIFENSTTREKLVASLARRHWYHGLTRIKANWRVVRIQQSETVKTAIQILRRSSQLSDDSLIMVIIEARLLKAKDLMEIFTILLRSSNQLRLLHLTQGSGLNTVTRKIASKSLPWLEVLSACDRGYHEAYHFDDFIDVTSSHEGTSGPESDKEKGRFKIRRYRTDALFHVDRVDLDWMKQVEVLAFTSLTSTSSLYEVLLNVKDSIKQLRLDCDRGDFERAESNDKSIVEFPVLEHLDLPRSMSRLIPSNWLFPSLSGLGGTLNSILDFKYPMMERISHLELFFFSGVMHADILPIILVDNKQLRKLGSSLLSSDPKQNNAALKSLLANLSPKLRKRGSTCCPSLSNLHLFTIPQGFKLRPLVTFKKQRTSFLNKDGEGMEKKVFNITFQSPELTAGFEKLLEEDGQKNNPRVRRRMSDNHDVPPQNIWELD